MDLQGNFSTTMTIPNAPGRYGLQTPGSQRRERECVGQRSLIPRRDLAGRRGPPAPDPKAAPDRRHAHASRSRLGQGYRRMSGATATGVESAVPSSTPNAERRCEERGYVAGYNGGGCCHWRGRRDTAGRRELASWRWSDLGVKAGWVPAPNKVRYYWWIQSEDYVNDYFCQRFPGERLSRRRSLSSPSGEEGRRRGGALVPHASSTRTANRSATP